MIAPRPILIIHGLNDTVVPPSDSRRVCARAGPTCRLWLVPHAGHICALFVAGQRYRARVLAFLHEAFTEAGDRAGASREQQPAK